MGNVRCKARWSLRLDLPGAHQLDEVSRRIGRSARERVVESRAEREQIRPCIEARPVHDLGRNELRCSHDEAARAHWHHGAEVDELGLAVACAPDVTRAHVAVHQAARGEKGERRADVVDERARLSPRQRGSLAKIAAVEQLHRVERPPIIDPVVVDLYDAGMRELCERAKLALEEGCGFEVVPVLFRQHQLLQSDVSPSSEIRHAIDDGHAAMADGPHHLVAVVDALGDRVGSRAVLSLEASVVSGLRRSGGARTGVHHQSPW